MGKVDDYLAQLAEYARQQAEAAEQHRIGMIREQEKLRGVKIVRYRFRVAVAAGAISVAADTGTNSIQGPDQGFAWSVMRLIVQGLTASATTPDVVNILNSATGSDVEWQLNGNQFGQVFSKGAFILNPGENIQITNVGTIAAAGPITVRGQAWQVPAEEIGKLL